MAGWEAMRRRSIVDRRRTSRPCGRSTERSKIVSGVRPTQKPVEIVARPIRYHTKPGELIFEPFSGSGTASVAAEKEGRRCYGMELSPAFVDVIVMRGSDKIDDENGIIAEHSRVLEASKF